MAVNLQTQASIKRHKIPEFGVHISYSPDPLKKPLGTGGPIKRAENLLNHQHPFLVLNGDILAHVNYTEILKQHQQKNATATLALHPVKDPSRYGVAELTQEKQIRRFVEKPSANTISTHLVNAGIYVLSPEIFEYIPKEEKVSIEREVFPKLAEEGKLYGYVFDGLWRDIGTMEGYLEVNKILLSSLPTSQEYQGENKGKIKKPVAFDHTVSIGEKSVIGPYTVLGREVTVGRNVNIQNSVIFPGTEISDSSSISGAVIGEKVVIGEEVKIGEGCVLGDHVKVEDNVSLAAGVSVCAAKQVSESVLTPKNII